MIIKLKLIELAKLANGAYAQRTKRVQQGVWTASCSSAGKREFPLPSPLLPFPFFPVRESKRVGVLHLLLPYNCITRRHSLLSFNFLRDVTAP